jgi:hypothetical protein
MDIDVDTQMTGAGLQQPSTSACRTRSQGDISEGDISEPRTDLAMVLTRKRRALGTGEPTVTKAAPQRRDFVTALETFVAKGLCDTPAAPAAAAGKPGDDRGSRREAAANDTDLLMSPPLISTAGGEPLPSVGCNNLDIDCPPTGAFSCMRPFCLAS